MKDHVTLRTGVMDAESTGHIETLILNCNNMFFYEFLIKVLESMRYFFKKKLLNGSVNPRFCLNLVFHAIFTDPMGVY